ncbi:MAG: hypothetical protein KF908_05170 [Nitrosomonas sp.]|nr:hypothetical protein [Nitrosomonas sp.]
MAADVSALRSSFKKFPQVMQKSDRPSRNQSGRRDKPEHRATRKNVPLDFIEPVNNVSLLLAVFFLLFNKLIESV